MTANSDKRIFDGIDFRNTEWEQAEYEDCSFTDCNFSDSVLSNIIFSDCRFEDCDFSNCRVPNASFRGVHFQACKLMGVYFDDCNEFLLSMNFHGCQLSLASFRKLKMKKSSWVDCNLQEVDFSESDLSGAAIQNCDLKGAIFEGTGLEKADLRKSFNYAIDPERNRIRKAKFSLPEVTGLLSKYSIDID